VSEHAIGIKGIIFYEVFLQNSVSLSGEREKMIDPASLRYAVTGWMNG